MIPVEPPFPQFSKKRVHINHHSLFPPTEIGMEPALFFASYPISIHLTEQQVMIDRVKGLAEVYQYYTHKVVIIQASSPVINTSNNYVLGGMAWSETRVSLMQNFVLLEVHIYLLMHMLLKNVCYYYRQNKYWSVVVLSPALKIGETLTAFHSPGTTPFALQIVARLLAIAAGLVVCCSTQLDLLPY